MLKPVLSADSHVTEPPDLYVDRIDKRFRKRAPRMVHDERRSDLFIIDGINRPIPMTLLSAAGIPPADIGKVEGNGRGWLQRGGWDPEARIGDQERDGIAAEILYPSVGMLLCKHLDHDYRKACMEAYNLWLAEFCAPHPDRLMGVGQVSMRSVDDAIAEVRRIKQLGLRGVMLPGWPQDEDYDSKLYDAFWAACVELDLPVTFHHLAGRRDPNDMPDAPYTDANRGVNTKLNGWMNLVRGNQDLLAMFVFGGVFERHPMLRLICAEADAGWVPHFMYRMDYAYSHHRHHIRTEPLSKAPSEYFRENVYVTFQDDLMAFQLRNFCNVRRLMWANDFPHFDSTWPRSREVIREHTAGMTDDEINLLVHDNLAECYRLDAV
ncbi:MAG TPA: amidohydrolase family protein [Candidatus Binataceae bacterium]|nr:amidohydrolase family protein [Candidatus Binataceae bacterium]